MPDDDARTGDIATARRSRGQLARHAHMAVENLMDALQQLQEEDADEGLVDTAEYFLQSSATQLEKYQEAILKCHVAEGLNDEEADQEEHNVQELKLRNEMLKAGGKISAIARRMMATKDEPNGRGEAHAGGAQQGHKPHNRKVDIPVLGSPEGMNLVTFRDWVKRFEDYAVITSLQEEDLRKRQAVIRSALDSEWTKMWTEGTIAIPEDGDTKAVIDALEAHLRRHRHILLDRMEFLQRRQREGETVDSYCTALRELDRSCGYTHACDERAEHQQERIRDRLVSGLRSSSMRQEVLKTPPEDLTLERVLKTCRNVESSNTTSSKLGGNGGTTVNAVRQKSAYKKDKTQQQEKEAAQRAQSGHQQTKAHSGGDKKCRNCGRSAHKSMDECPARGKDCNGCGKQGHFKSVCRSKNDTSGEKTRGNAVSAIFCGVHQPEGGRSRDGHGLVTVRILDAHGKRTLGDIDMLPDTGADANVMSLSDYTRLGRKRDFLRRPAETFTAYNGSPIPVLGWDTMTIQADKRSFKRTFYVTEEGHGSILCRRTAEDLGIVTLKHPTHPPQMDTRGTRAVRQVAADKKSPPKDREAFRSYILQEYADVFDDEREELPPMKGHPVHIELTEDARPTQVNGPRPVPLPLRKAAKGLLDDLEQRGVIEPVTEPTEWLHPVTFVPKKPGSDKLRLTVDLRKLNVYVKRPQHPVRSSHDCVSSVPPTAQFFSTFDAKMGYHQVELDTESQLLTTFATPWGRYKHIRATMGLTSAGDEYNRRTDAALANLPNTEKIVDDVLLYDGTWEAHQGHIEQFLRRCREHGMTLNPKKFQLGEEEVPFAGHIVGRKGYRADPDKLKAIQNFPRPANITDLRSFQGLCEQLAGFSREVTEAFQALRPLLRGKSEFIWCPEHERAFEATKAALVSPPVLAYFDATRPTRLETDASRTRGLGYALLQQDEDKNWHLIEARSRSITETEARYAMVELELLGVRWAMKRARHFLFGLPTFTLVVDHQPLVSILNRQTLDSIDNPRLQRLKTDINAYQFRTIWKQGKEHKIADALSRAPVDDPQEEDLDDEQALFGCGQQMVQINAVSIERELNEGTDCTRLADPILQELRERAQEDPEYTALQAHLKSGNRKLPDGLKHYQQVVHEMATTPEELIVRHQRLLIPANHRREILRRLHASHQGIERTLRAARQKVYWPGLTADVKSTVEACGECQRRRPGHAKEPLESDPRPSRVFEELAADFFETRGRHFLAVIDRYSGFPFIAHFPSPPNARSTILELKRIFTLVGCPVRLYTDGGLQFTAQDTQDFLRQWGIAHRLSTPHYAQSNGLAEAAVKVLKSLVEKTGGHINDAFQTGLLELRNTPRAGGKSPAEIVYGHPMRTTVPMHHDAFDKKWLIDMNTHDRRTASRQKQATEAYNMHTRKLPHLSVGQHVRIRDHMTKEWDMTGIVMSRGQHRDYRVRLPSGRTYWRNRRLLRAMPPPEEDDIEPTHDGPKKLPSEVDKRDATPEGRKTGSEGNSNKMPSTPMDKKGTPGRKKKPGQGAKPPRRSTRLKKTPNRLTY